MLTGNKNITTSVFAVCFSFTCAYMPCFAAEIPALPDNGNFQNSETWQASTSEYNLFYAIVDMLTTEEHNEKQKETSPREKTDTNPPKNITNNH